MVINTTEEEDFLKSLTTPFSYCCMILRGDRFGTIVALLKNNEKWNGSYQGKIAPTTEYWFLAELVDNKGVTYQRKGHFSLKL